MKITLRHVALVIFVGFCALVVYKPQDWLPWFNTKLPSHFMVMMVLFLLLLRHKKK